MTNTGVAIFDDKKQPIEVLSVPTDSKKSYGERLQTIASKLIELKKKYRITKAILEAGFFRHIKSTQAIYRVHGVVNYLFFDVEQFSAPPSTIKKLVVGKGTADKKQVQEKILEIYPYLKFQNEDESDAVAIGHAYLCSEESFTSMNK